MDVLESIRPWLFWDNVCKDCLAAIDSDVFWPPYHNVAVLARTVVFTKGRHFHLTA